MSIILETWDNLYVISLQVLTEKRHSRYIQDSWYIQNSGIFRNLAYMKAEAYSEPWYIQNFGTFRTRDIIRILGYSKPCNIQNQRHTQNLVKHLEWSALRNSYLL